MEGLRAALRGRSPTPISPVADGCRSPLLGECPTADPRLGSNAPGLAQNMKLRLKNRRVAKPHPGSPPPGPIATSFLVE